MRVLVVASAFLGVALAPSCGDGGGGSGGGGFAGGDLGGGPVGAGPDCGCACGMCGVACDSAQDGDPNTPNFCNGAVALPQCASCLVGSCGFTSEQTSDVTLCQ